MEVFDHQRLVRTRLSQWDHGVVWTVSSKSVHHRVVEVHFGIQVVQKRRLISWFPIPVRLHNKASEDTKKQSNLVPFLRAVLSLYLTYRLIASPLFGTLSVLITERTLSRKHKSTHDHRQIFGQFQIGKCKRRTKPVLGTWNRLKASVEKLREVFDRLGVLGNASVSDRKANVFQRWQLGRELHELRTSLGITQRADRCMHVHRIALNNRDP